MQPIFITLTEHKAGHKQVRTINVNHIVAMETNTVKPGTRATRLELTGAGLIQVMESQQQIKLLTDQATHYA